MKQNLTISIDPEQVEKIRNLGLSISGFVQQAMDIFLDSGFDEYGSELKIHMLQEGIDKLQQEREILLVRVNHIDTQLERMQQMIVDTNEHVELLRSVDRLAQLTQRLNRIIIGCMYDEETIRNLHGDLLKQMYNANPDFDLSTHIALLKKLIGSG